MDDPFGLFVWLAAFVVLVAVGVMALRAVGPADWSLFRARRDVSWPHGIQEEEPTPWHFDRVEGAGTLDAPQGGGAASAGGAADGVHAATDDHGPGGARGGPHDPRPAGATGAGDADGAGDGGPDAIQDPTGGANPRA